MTRSRVGMVLALALGCSPAPGRSVVVDAHDPSPEATSEPQPARAEQARADWQGVYFNPLFGHLHLVPKGDEVDGRWQRPTKSHWGELNGTVERDRLRFAWKEHQEGAPSTSGRGYFVYRRAAEGGTDDSIEGEIGTGEAESGTAWEAIRQRNVAPSLEPQPGDAPGTDWDE